MSPPRWLERERTDRQRQETRYRQQFQPGTVWRFEPRPLSPADPDADSPREAVLHPRHGQVATVLRAPRTDTKAASVRVCFEDGEALTVRPATLKRFETDPYVRPKDAPQGPPRPGRLLHPPPEFPETPPEPTTVQALHRISQDARAEINRLAQAIHRRHFVAAPRSPRPGQLAREVASTVSLIAPTLSPDAGPGHGQPRSNPDAASVSEHWLGSYSDALMACKALHAGKWEDAAHYAGLALGKQQAYRQASRRLEQTQVRTSSGRYFHGELLSVRHHHPCDDPRLQAAFEQWYVRLVLIWAADGVTLTVANAAQLEGESGIEVGPDGWNDLVRWITDHTEVLDGRRRGRRLDDDRDLIYLWREDREEFELRRRVYREYPGLPRAFEALRRAMHQPLELDPGELPDDRPAIGYHPPAPREALPDTGETIGDDELSLAADG